MGREERDRVGRKAGRKTGKEMKNQTTAERGKERTGRPAWRLREINPNRHKRNMLYLLTAPFGLYRTIESLPILQKIQLVYSPLPPKVAASQGIKKGFPILFVLDLSYPFPYHTPFPVWEGQHHLFASQREKKNQTTSLRSQNLFRF